MKKKNKHITFSLLLLLSLPLAILVIYLSFNTLPFSYTKKENTTTKISEVVKPTHSVNSLEIDTDLSKFPSDYDTLIALLDTTLTQHQKTTLLLYGESVSLSKQESITKGYEELVKKNIPILIPQEYINRYLEEEFSKYLSLIEDKDKAILNAPLTTDSLYTNAYDEYISGQLKSETSLQTKNYLENSEIKSLNGDFLLDLDEESINGAYYKLRMLRHLSEKLNLDIDLGNTTNFLNSLLLYSSSEDANSRNRLRYELANILLSNNLNVGENIHWKFTVIDGKTYVYPISIQTEFVVNNTNFNETYDVQPTIQSRGTVRVPIFMYHQIAPIPAGSSFVAGLYVEPNMFEEQLAYLVKHNYKAITPQELYNLLLGGINPVQKSVMITFDDSTESQYRNGYPLLKKYGLTGVFYVVTNRTSITYNQLREMASEGMIIDSHSASHVDLTKLTDAPSLSAEIVGSRNTLRSAIGQDVVSIAYPGCVIDSKGYPYVHQAGYLIGVSCGRSIDHTLKNRLSLSRVHVFSSMENLKNLLSGVQ